jgi:hypothetical protein
MKSIVALSLIALALGACAGQPTWNTSVFPEQPEYGMSAPASAVAEAPKK